MLSPFPGMDPYLESPSLWPNVHHGLIVAIQELLNREILPKYACSIEERVYVSADPYPALTGIRVPDVLVTTTSTDAMAAPSRLQASLSSDYETFEIDETASDPLREPRIVVRRTAGGAVVTVLELLSPANKARGLRTREEYLEKRREILRSAAHLLEIDLLRAGTPPLAGLSHETARYGVYLNMAPDHRRTRVTRWDLQKRLPALHVPLLPPDPPARLDLQTALNLAYERGAYHAFVDYSLPPEPPLADADRAWAAEVIAAWRNRQGD